MIEKKKAERLLPNDFRKLVQRRIYYFVLKRSILNKNVIDLKKKKRAGPEKTS